MTKQWRLLNEGERIELGDEWLMCSGEWKSVTNSVTGTPIQAQLLPHRRLISNQGWIKLSERVPTEANATNGLVLVKFKDAPDPSPHSYSSVICYPSATHWCEIPKFEEQDEDEEAFREATRPLAKLMIPVRECDARKIWDAALEYARKKQ